MKVLVTGAKGYIGKTLCWWLKSSGHEVVEFNRENTFEELAEQLADIKFIVHLAGVTHSENPKEYYEGNYKLSVKLVEMVMASGYDIPIIYASSSEAINDSDYGKAKKMTEEYLLSCPLLVYVYRLDNVIGFGRRQENDPFVSSLADLIIKNEEYKIPNPTEKITWITALQVCETFESIISNRFEADDSMILTISGTEASLSYIEGWYQIFNRHPYILPTYKDKFVNHLYLAFLSHRGDFMYPFNENYDETGFYQEVMSSSEGHIAIEVVRDGAVHGNCYHTKKIKDYVTIVGQTVIKTRKYDKEVIIENKSVSDKPTPVRILAGCAYEINNSFEAPALLVSWCNEVDKENDPDIIEEPVVKVVEVEEAEHYYY